MPTTIPVQTRLAPPAPAALCRAAPSAVTPIGHSSLGMSDQHSASARRHSAPAPAGTVSLQIDSLVLHGFSAAEGRRVGAAFEKELTRLLTESPLSESSLGASSTSSSDSTTIGHWSLNIGHSGAVGAGAARALHARLRA